MGYGGTDIAFHFDRAGWTWACAAISNLTNHEARPHHSFFRYRAPLAGRSLALGGRRYF